MNSFNQFQEAQAFAKKHLDEGFVWIEEKEASYDLELFLSQYRSGVAGLLVAAGPCEGEWELCEDYSLREKDYSFIDGYNMKRIYALTGRLFLELVDEESGLDLKRVKELRGFPIPKKVEGIERRPALFLDRDGVIIHDSGYVHKKEDVRLYQDVIPLIQWANLNNWRVCVLTNQAGLAYGLFDVEALESVHRTIDELLHKEGATIDAWYACPFVRSKKSISMFNFDSIRRKPHAGLLLDACEDFPIDVKKSVMIGDKTSDQLLVGGLEALLVRRQYDLDSATAPIFSSLAEVLSYLQKRN